MHFSLTLKTLLLILVILMLMGNPSHMVLHHLNTSGHMLLELAKLQLMLKLRTLCVHVILIVLVRFLRTLVVTTTVRLVNNAGIDRFVCFFTMILCGMGSSVMVWRLPAVLTPTCHSLSRHSVRPPRIHYFDASFSRSYSYQECL